ncbi:MAG: hypothetical protein ABSG16_12370 [Candidatus Acidiferrum sp.]|jgi:hypothetical protein
MATKRKNKKKAAKKFVKKTAAKKATKKPAARKLVASKPAAKKIAAVKAAGKPSVKAWPKTVAKAPARKGKKTVKTAVKPPRITTRGLNEINDSVDFEPKGLGARSAGQSGDLQGLSNVAGADSESVDELVEEGNAFEAGIIKGVQDVPDADEGDIVTHEVPEDDVPREYDNEEE